MDNTERITRTEMYGEIVKTISRRSTCIRKNVGAILVKDKRIVAMGYNGVLPGVDPEYGIDPVTRESKTIHAEANIIAYCAKNGISTNGCKMYITLSPCKKCAELITQSGITEVHYWEKYRCEEGINTLINQKIKVCQVCIG